MKIKLIDLDLCRIPVTKSDVEFDVNGRHVKFSVIHNLEEVDGMSFMDALDSWLVRTSLFTAKGLCKYIMSKDENFMALTEAEYNKLNTK